jgi:hypothetical protein
MQRYNFSMREGGMIETTEYDNTFVRWEEAEERIAALEAELEPLRDAVRVLGKAILSFDKQQRRAAMEYIESNPIARAAVEGGGQ